VVEYDPSYSVNDVWENTVTSVGFTGNMGTKILNMWSSDARLKKDIAPCVTNASNALRQIGFIAYRFPDEADTVRHEVGFSAQQLQTVRPEFVIEGEPLTPEFPLLLTYLLKALQEQIPRVRALREAVRVLREAA